MIGLYVHIPFCARRCHYCNYVVTTRRSTDSRAQFFKALGKEIRHASMTYGRFSFDTLYLGGGTPSDLASGEMEHIFRLIREAFVLKEDAEITCEVNPGDTAEQKLDCYKKLGINRISLGVQSFDDRRLHEMGRIHGSKEIYETYQSLRDRGFGNISIDLIDRLPGQSVGEWEKTLSEARRLGPEQIVVYDLNVHPGTVFGSRAVRGTLDLPSEEDHEVLWDKTEEMLVEEGSYLQYEISSFAQPGFESRHNLIYWHNEEYLGLGPGAFSYVRPNRYVFAQNMDRYLEKISRCDWAHDDETELGLREREMESVLTGLRLQEGVCLSDYPLIRGELLDGISKLEDTGLLVRENGNLKLTRRGRRLAETVFTELSFGDSHFLGTPAESANVPKK